MRDELKRTWSPNYDNFSKHALADVQIICLLAPANRFDIDLEQALVDKWVKKDSRREWKSARKP